MLTLVPTPIGNISDISLRAIEAFENADILLCEDTRVTKKLLHLLKERHNLKTDHEQEFISLHVHNESYFIEKLTPEYFEQNIIYVSDAGMPGISDPGQELVRYCIDQGIEYDILPGANAVLTAFVASGFVSTKMLFFGFLAHKGSNRAKDLNEALFNGYSTVLYESPHRLAKCLSEIAAIDPARQIFAAKEISKKHQTFYKGSALEVQEKIGTNIKGEWVLVIEAKTQNEVSFNERDILSFDLPKKAAAKIISKITGETPKACYTRLLETE